MLKTFPKIGDSLTLASDYRIATSEYQNRINGIVVYAKENTNDNWEDVGNIAIEYVDENGRTKLIALSSTWSDCDDSGNCGLVFWQEDSDDSTPWFID